MDYTDDPVAFPNAAGLIDLVPAELAKRSLPETCFSGVVPGTTPALDYVYASDCGGMAWSRVTQLYPSTNFPLNDQAVSAGYAVPPLAQTYELGLIRRAPVPDNGQPPAAEEQYDAGRIAMADQRALLAVICRWFQSRDIPFLLGAWTPVGPDGAVVGGYWTVTARGS